MSIRRSKFEIYMEILNQIRNGVNLPTRIMYNANLSWKPLSGVLKSLLYQGLIEGSQEEKGDKRTRTKYIITEKGNNVLKYFKQAKDMIELEDAPRLGRR